MAPSFRMITYVWKTDLCGLYTTHLNLLIRFVVNRAACLTKLQQADGLAKLAHRRNSRSVADGERSQEHALRRRVVAGPEVARVPGDKVAMVTRFK